MAREEGLAKQHTSDASTLRQLYDDWSSSYDDDLAGWGYEAPVQAVDFLAASVNTDVQILDAGCGTGLVGAALSAKGFHDVVGVDVSSQSLDLAALTGYYRALAEVDLTSRPTSLLDASFSALISVGVMTYMPDVEATCREFCRVVEPSGTIVLTQRTDLFESRNTQAVFDALEADRTWRIVEVTAGRPYLPGHDEYDGIDVHYGVFERQ